MKKIISAILILAGVLACAASAAAGPYPADGYTTSDADFVAWASAVIDYSGYNSSSVENILGELDRSLAVGASEGGYITLGFDTTITNGSGADFVVWENGFEVNGTGGLVYAELGYVSVSTNGTDWATFSSVSLTEASSNPFVDPTDVYNLAGNHVAYYTDVENFEGTAFDLDDLLAAAEVVGGLVDLGDINYIMITDVVSGSDTDSQGNVIYDGLSYGGGADWNAVGVINAVPIPGAAWLLFFGIGRNGNPQTETKDRITFHRA